VRLRRDPRGRADGRRRAPRPARRDPGRLAELTFDHHEAHPNFIRLVAIDNIHRADHTQASGRFADLSMPAIERIARIHERGRADGTFTRDADPVDVHMIISAYCVFLVANRDLLDPRTRKHYRAILGDLVVDYLTGAHHPSVPGGPLNGPINSAVIHPP
jgi:Tetracyclin repressor-like, C-terminal domain